MLPSTVLKAAPKPPGWWIAVTIAAGVIGAFAGITFAARGTYEVAPFKIDLSARFVPAGKTEFELKPSQLSPGFAEAGTHAAPLAFRAVVTDLSGSLLDSDARAAATPYGFSEHLAENGRSAIIAFALKTAIVALIGSAMAGAAISFGRIRRIIGATVAGILTVAVVGAMTAATYDRDEFKKTQFRRSSSTPDLPIG